MWYFKSFRYLLPLFVFLGCITDYDGPLPIAEPIPVLNGVLYADSVFAFDLTWSNPPNKIEFDGIANTSVVLYKNDVEINTAIEVNNDGRYVLDDTCRNGDAYSIALNIPNYPTLSAVAKLPQKPTIRLTKETRQSNENPVYALTVENIEEEIHAVYVFLFVEETIENGQKDWTQRGIYCNSPYADAFNRLFDAMGPEGFSYEYEAFLRFPTTNLTHKKLETELAFNGVGSTNRFYILSATKAYDLYFKGGYLQRSFDPEIDLPFTYQAIFLPSNVINGAGIFAGIDVEMFDFN